MRPGSRARGLIRLADRAHHALKAVCMTLLAALLSIELCVVLLRYGLNTGSLWLQDLALYLFAMLVLLGLPVALADDRHVRVDVLRERQSVRTRRVIDTAGLALFLVPALLLTLYHVAPDVLYSWSIREGSRETGGLGGVYLVKTVLPLSCLLMLLQGGARVLACWSDDERRSDEEKRI